MSRTRRPELLAADMLRELTQPYTTSETGGPVYAPVPTTLPPPYTRGHRRGWVLLPGNQTHVVHHPGLLDQIDQTVTGRTVGQETFQTAYGSKPAGRLDCLALLHRVDQQSRQLADEHGVPLLPVRARLTRLSGALGHRPHPVVRSWWLTARVLTQHDGPPFAPDVPCPVETCERRGSLRIRPDQRIAVCVECQSTWDEDPDSKTVWSFGRLAIWVEWAAEHLAGARHWLTDADGYPVECTECLVERQAMAERLAQRGVGARLRDAMRHADAS